MVLLFSSFHKYESAKGFFFLFVSMKCHQIFFFCSRVCSVVGIFYFVHNYEVVCDFFWFMSLK